jgi:regulator of protease activity HflC (stomatin/prohibitin superfamily)
MFVFAIIVLIVGIVVLVATARLARGRRVAGPDDRPDAGFRIGSLVARGVGVVLIGLSAVLFFFTSFFTQDPGEANVLRDWTGNIVGQESTPGFHWKAPWVDTVTFDVRNQRVVFVSEQEPGQGDNVGGIPNGPQITVQDAEGVTANIDIAIRYSIKPDSVIDIYKGYFNEDNLRTRLIYNDIRSVVRSVPGEFKTLQLLTDRNAVQEAILEALEDRWEDDGIIVEDVALQEIRYGDSVTSAFAAAQEANINVQTEQAKLDAAKVSAQQKVVQAQAEADANAILAASLTDAILKQRYLDTLKELAAAGNVVVVPDGFNGLVNVGK